MALKKQHRLKQSNIITKIFSASRPFQEGGVSVRALAGRPGPSRFVVVVPLKVAPLATQRNAIRRRVTEMLRKIVLTGGLVEQKEIVVTVNNAMMGATPLESALVLLLRKSGILQQ